MRSHVNVTTFYYHALLSRIMGSNFQNTREFQNAVFLIKRTADLFWDSIIDDQKKNCEVPLCLLREVADITSELKDNLNSKLESDEQPRLY